MPAKFDVNPPEGTRFGSIISKQEGQPFRRTGGRWPSWPRTAKGETLLLCAAAGIAGWRERCRGPAKAGRPFWSPDSKSLAFVAGGKLKRIEVAGGSPITLCVHVSPAAGRGMRTE